MKTPACASTNTSRSRWPFSSLARKHTAAYCENLSFNFERLPVREKCSFFCSWCLSVRVKRTRNNNFCWLRYIFARKHRLAALAALVTLIEPIKIESGPSARTYIRKKQITVKRVNAADCIHGGKRQRRLADFRERVSQYDIHILYVLVDLQCPYIPMWKWWLMYSITN